MRRRRDRELLRDLGQRMREVRTKAGWTQQQLAEAVGVAPNSISRFETGERGLSLPVLSSAAQHLAVSLGDLLDGTRPAPTSTSPPSEDAELLRTWHRLESDERALALHLLNEVVRHRGR